MNTEFLCYISILLIVKDRQVLRKAMDKNARTELYKAAEKGDLEKVKLLVERDKDVNDRHGTPLDAAVNEGHTEMVKFLLGKSDPVSTVEYAKNRGLLYTAARKGYTEIVNLLLKYGVPINATDMYGMNPIHWAALNNEVAVIEMMLKYGADIKAENGWGLTPLQIAIREGQIENLENVSYRIGLLNLVVTNSYTEIVLLLLGHEVPINDTDMQVFGPLQWAALRNEIQIARLILEHGANVNKKDIEGQRTPLHLAIEEGHEAMVELLLANKADVDATDKDGRTPMDLARAKNFSPIIEILLAHVANEH